MKPITNKRQMYALLASGALGNTIPQRFSLGDWKASPEYGRYEAWGVRTLTPGGPCRLYCPSAEVATTVEAFTVAGHAVSISVMIDAVVRVTLMADVYDSDTGLIVYGVEYPDRGASWRKVMPEQGRQYNGISARMLLRKHLNANSLADLEALREMWPGHVYELSACETCIGCVPGRNSVVWEVRQY